MIPGGGAGEAERHRLSDRGWRWDEEAEWRSWNVGLHILKTNEKMCERILIIKFSSQICVDLTTNA